MYGEVVTVKVTRFAAKVTRKEGGRISISIAQVMEVLRITNAIVGGALYREIRKLKGR